MITMLIVLGGAIATLLIMSILSFYVNRSVYGKFVDDKKAVSYIVRAKNARRIRLNQFDDSIMQIKNGSFIAIHRCIGLPISKWYIHDVGIVPRWTKTHRLIEKIYAELKVKHEYENGDSYENAFGTI